MKKFKAAPQSAKRIKAIVAAAMALTLAVPTTAYFSSKPSVAEAEEALPEAVATVTMEKGFIGEKQINGLSVVKSEQILLFKELMTGADGKQFIYDGKNKVYDVTDDPCIEADAYKYGCKGNQPSTAYDDNLGSVLVFDDTVIVDEFVKKEKDELDTKAEADSSFTAPKVGDVLQLATVAHSQVQINNPFAGKNLSNGASVSYWVRPVAKSDDQTKGANSTLVVFSAKDDDNRKADSFNTAAKQAEREADGSLSVQISANNDFHYVASPAGVSVAYEGDGSVLAKPGQWSYVTVTMTDNKIVTYVNGEEVSNKDVEATGLTAALADSNTGVFFGGNYSPAAEAVGQNYGTVRNTCMDDMAFYTKALTAEEAKRLYDAAKNEADTIEEPQVLEKFTFENGLTGENGTTISGIATNKSTDPVVAVDAERGNVLKMSAGTASKSASGQLSKNPFAGKDLNGASVSYWVKEPADSKLKTVIPSVSLSFVDEPKKIEYDKMSDAAKGEMSSSVLYTQTDMEAYFYEGYTGQAYKSLGNKFLFSTKKNTHIDAKTDSNGNIIDSLYDEDAVAKQKEYEERLTSMSEWHMVTAVFTNAGIKMYYDGKPLTNNLADPDDKQYMPAFFGPRFFDGYYKMQYDGYAPFYRATDNQGARTLMSLLTGDDTSAYLGMMYKDGTNNTFLRTYETYYDDITYYATAMTDAQVQEVYKKATEQEIIIPSIEPQVSEEPQNTEGTTTPSTGASVTTDTSATTGDAAAPVSTDDESVVAPKNAYSGKTGDTADVVVPVVALSVAAAAFVTVSRKKRKIEE